jgi:hypothetical protein
MVEAPKLAKKLTKKMYTRHVQVSSTQYRVSSALRLSLS